MRVLLEFGLGLGLRGAFGPGLVWSGLYGMHSLKRGLRYDSTVKYTIH
jgi:hypothetical protein